VGFDGLLISNYIYCVNTDMFTDCKLASLKTYQLLFGCSANWN